MSKYHAGCSKSDNQLPKQTKAQSLKSKPLCDCRGCKCKKCPDILEQLSIKVTGTSCDFGQKRTCDNRPLQAKTCDQQEPARNSLLNVINAERTCSCEVMARAIRSHIHINLGLPDRRNVLDYSEYEQSTSSDKDVKLP